MRAKNRSTDSILQSFSKTELLLALRYPAVLSVRQACEELSLSYAATLNSLSKGSCQIPFYKNGRRWYIRLADLASYIDRSPLHDVSSKCSPSTKRRRGRPTKVEQVRQRDSLPIATGWSEK
ncbi:helix-turn-helix domain-containing protein [Neisseriaceae bacterium JH1-16]|nr:helix-turn-helix domain-containing protein [Neisseriaceae bacterium JH1-16]